MNIDIIIHETAEAIKNIPAIGDTPVFEEDEGDIAQKIEVEIGQTNRCIVVGWNGCEHVATQRPQGDDPDALYVQPEIVVSVFETPVTNRTDENAPRLLGMAAEIAKAVNDLGTEDMDEGLHFVKISPIQQLDRGVITCDVVFRTKNTI